MDDSSHSSGCSDLYVIQKYQRLKNLKFEIIHIQGLVRYSAPVVAMGAGPGGPVGRPEFGCGYFCAHLMQVLDLMGGSLAGWSLTLMTMRDRWSA